jgi:hypothetical protein
LTKPITCIVGRLRAMNSKDAPVPPRSVNGPRHCAQRHENTKSRSESGVPSITTICGPAGTRNRG